MIGCPTVPAAGAVAVERRRRVVGCAHRRELVAGDDGALVPLDLVEDARERDGWIRTGRAATPSAADRHGVGVVEVGDRPVRVGVQVKLHIQLSVDKEPRLARGDVPHQREEVEVAVGHVLGTEDLQPGGVAVRPVFADEPLVEPVLGDP